MKDTHIHISHKPYDSIFSYIAMDGKDYVIKTDGSREKLIQEMKENGVECCIEPAIDANSNERLLKLRKEYPDFIYAAVGNHPTRCIKSPFRDFKRVREYAMNNAEDIVAIGEAGLDYHISRKEQRRIKQKIWFLFQINLADKLGLPLILHIRMADEDAIKILRRNKRKLHGGVCHCFGGGPDVARVYTGLGFCLGIGGTLLMRDEVSAPLQETVKEIPIEYILLETDGPYVRPAKPQVEEISNKKWQKARNTSLILPAVIDRIAELKGISASEVERITSENAKRVFPRIDRL